MNCRWAPLGFVALFVVACGEAREGVAPIELESEAGEFQGVFTTEPAPPTTGENQLSIELSTANGNPVAGADLSIELWMAAHGHGSDVVPAVSRRAAGAYDVDHVVFPMPGRWQLTIDVQTEDVRDAFELWLEVN